MEGFEKIKPLRSEDSLLEQMFYSLPEEMQTYCGLVPEGLFEKKEDAGPNPLPYVVVNFKFGGKMALHISPPSEVGASVEEQVNKLIEAGKHAENIESVELFWKQRS